MIQHIFVCVWGVLLLIYKCKLVDLSPIDPHTFIHSTKILFISMVLYWPLWKGLPKKKICMQMRFLFQTFINYVKKKSYIWYIWPHKVQANVRYGPMKISYNQITWMKVFLTISLYKRIFDHANSEIWWNWLARFDIWSCRFRNEEKPSSVS